MSHPILQCLDIADVILQVARSKRVPKFVKKEIRTVRPLRTFVAVFRHALPAIHFRVEGDALQPLPRFDMSVSPYSGRP
jgi:hypothetical protein